MGETNTENKNNWYWPDLNDLEASVSACKIAAGFGTASAVLTGGAVLAGFVGPLAMLDVGIMAACVLFLLFKKSRTAAVGLLGIFVLGKLVQLSAGQINGGSMVMTAIFCLAYINGVRGSFAYHRLRKSADEPKSTDETQSLDEPQSSDQNMAA